VKKEEFDALIDVNMDLRGAVFICPVGMFKITEDEGTLLVLTDSGEREPTEEELEALLRFVEGE
jgi:hypothetical protein